MHASLTWRALFAVTIARESERDKEWKEARERERERSVSTAFMFLMSHESSYGNLSSVGEISLIMYSSYIGPPHWETDTRTNTHTFIHILHTRLQMHKQTLSSSVLCSMCFWCNSSIKQVDYVNLDMWISYLYFTGPSLWKHELRTLFQNVGSCLTVYCLWRWVLVDRITC